MRVISGMGQKSALPHPIHPNIEYSLGDLAFSVPEAEGHPSSYSAKNGFEIIKWGQIVFAACKSPLSSNTDKGMVQCL